MYKSRKSNNSIILINSVLIALSLSVAQPVYSQEKAQLNREMLLTKEVDFDSNRIKTKLVRVTFPVGFKTPWHGHKGPGPRYILKGELKVTESGETNSYSAGDVFWETGKRMLVENIGQEEAQLVIFELSAE